MTKLEILKAKIEAIELIEEKISNIKNYDIRTASDDYELDKYDIEANQKAEERIARLTYIMEKLAE